MRTTRVLRIVLALSLAMTSGCMMLRGPATFSIAPAATYVKQLCPDLTYEVVSEFTHSWTGWGFLGMPTGAKQPNVIKTINEEVAKANGDGAIDVKVETGQRVMMFIFWTQANSTYRLTGKVIRYTNKVCQESERG